MSKKTLLFYSLSNKNLIFAGELNSNNALSEEKVFEAFDFNINFEHMKEKLTKEKNPVSIEDFLFGKESIRQPDENNALFVKNRRFSQAAAVLSKEEKISNSELFKLHIKLKTKEEDVYFDILEAISRFHAFNLLIQKVMLTDKSFDYLCQQYDLMESNYRISRSRRNKNTGKVCFFDTKCDFTKTYYKNNHETAALDVVLDIHPNREINLMLGPLKDGSADMLNPAKGLNNFLEASLESSHQFASEVIVIFFEAEKSKLANIIKLAVS